MLVPHMREFDEFDLSCNVYRVLPPPVFDGGAFSCHCLEIRRQGYFVGLWNHVGHFADCQAARLPGLRVVGTVFAGLGLDCGH